MTVSSSTNKVSYSGNGSLTTFAYTFKIFDQGDLTVILRAADGTETTQTITTHYTVSGVGSASGGNVVFGSAPASGVTVVIIREQPLTQGLDLVANDPFPAESLEEALDKLVFMSQKHEEELSRAIKGSRTNVISNSEFTVSATDRANKVFSFDASGNLSIAQELGTFKGNWATSTTYVARDIVKDTSTNNIFIVNTAHTSSGAQPLTTNANSAKYDLIVDAASSTTAQTAAASSATAAASSATAAQTAQAASETAQTASETAKTASETAKTAAETAQAAAETALDSFDDRYLGAKSTSGGNPTTDNDGNNLIDGALFFDTTNNVLMVYNLGTTTWLRTTPTSSDQTAINAVNADATDIGTVAGISSNVTTVAGISSNVTTVAGISSDVTAVANDATDIGTVATNISNVNTVGGISSNVTTVAGISANVTTVAGISANVTTVAGDTTNIGTVATDLSGSDTIGTVAGSISNVNSLAGVLTGTTTFTVTVANVGGVNIFVIDGVNNPTLSLVRGNSYIFDQSHSSNSGHPLRFKDGSGNSYSNGVTVTGTPGSSGAKVTFEVPSDAPSSLRYYCTVHGNAMGNTITASSNNLSVVAGSIANVNLVGNSITNVNLVGGSISNVNTVASNLTSVNSFADTYRVGSSDPTSSNDEGDLFYNTTSNTLKVYNGSVWEAGVTAGSGFLALTGGQLTGNLTFSGSQTVDGRDVSADGAKLDGIEAGATADQTKADIEALAIQSVGTLSTLTVDDITINDSTISDSGSLTLDSGGSITIDADTNGTVSFKDNGNKYLDIYHSNDDVHIQSSVNDKDIIFRGNDNNNFITALTLDMSEAGAATFNSTVTATSFVGDGSNLTGVGGGGTLEATASGAIANGDTCIINTNGTVSAVGTTTSAPSSSYNAELSETSSQFYRNILYDTTNNKIFIFYKGQNNYAYGRIGTVAANGASISWGSRTTIDTGSGSSYHRSCFDPSTGKIVVILRRSSTAYARVVDISSGSISVGSESSIGTLYPTYMDITHDASSNKNVLIYKNNQGYIMVRTIETSSANSNMTLGTLTTLRALSGGQECGIVYHAAASCCIGVYRTFSNNIHAFRAKTIDTNGSNPAFGSEIVITNDRVYISENYHFSMAYDTVNEKSVVVYSDNTTQDHLIRQLSISTSAYDGTLSASAAFTIDTNWSKANSVVYNASSGNFAVAWEDESIDDTKAITVAINGSSFTKSSVTTINSSGGGNTKTAYDPDTESVWIFYHPADNSMHFANYFTESVVTNLTTENYIGISDAAYSDGATATIQIVGSVDDAQSGLTAGRTHYIQNDGSLSTTAANPSVVAGTAVSATKLIVKG